MNRRWFDYIVIKHFYMVLTTPYTFPLKAAAADEEREYGILLLYEIWVGGREKSISII